MGDGIDRRSFLKWTAAGAASVALPGWLTGQTPPPDARKPNIVLLMADDLGYECLGCDGGLSYRTPALDGLARAGARFEHCHSQPLCTPSRVQIMTGRYNSRNYVRFGAFDYRERTFAHLLRQAGYATCVVGKWQLVDARVGDAKADAIGPRKRPDAAGFDEYCLWQLSDRKSRYWDPLIEQNGAFLKQTAGKYGPDIFCNYAIDFMTRHRAKPFLLYYPMCLTHIPYVPTPDTRGAGGKGPQFGPMVEYMDKIVGRLVTKLGELGLLENTLILFTGDNGTGRGVRTRTRDGIVRGGKGGTLDTGTHVPLLAHWKGTIRPGQVRDDLVDFTDFLPTLADAAGADLPEGVAIDGRSFLPPLRGQKGRPRDWIYCYYTDKAGKFQTRFARDRRFKLHGDGRLFDTRADANEKSPIASAADTAASADSRKKLQAVLDEQAKNVTRPGRGKS